MKPNISLPYMPTQTVSPAQLLVKLSNIKLGKEISNKKLKQIKQVEQQISFYEDYCVSTMENLQYKLSGLNKDVNELKKSFKKAQDVGVLKFDKVQKMLQQTLDEYEQNRKKGQQMIDKLVQTVEEQLQKAILQKSMKSSLLVQQYLKINTRLQSIISSLSSMQSQMMSQYQKLKTQMNMKFSNIQVLILSQINETDKDAEVLLNKLEKIEQQCEFQINAINERKQNKRYQLHQMMEKMIEDAVEIDNYQ